MRRLAMGALLALGLAKCEPSLPGSWLEFFSTDRNTMTIGSDGSGVARLTYVGGSDEFEIEWREAGSREFELTMDCVANTRTAEPCDFDDFMMSCTLDSDLGDDLWCTGDALWTDYAFAWERETE